MKKIIYLFLNRPVTSLMFFSSVFVVGIVSFFNIPIELMPYTEYPRLTISAAWGNTSPEAVEAYLTSPLESALSSIKGVKQISSQSSEGSSNIDIVFHSSTDINFARIEINEKLSSMIEELPYGVSVPKISSFIPREFKDLQGFLTYTVSANVSANEIRKYSVDYLKTPLLSIDGVSDVKIRGGNEREIIIKVDYDKVKAFNLKGEDVFAAIKNAEQIIPAGSIKKGASEFLVKVNNTVSAAQTLLEQPVKTYGSFVVRMKDIAEVTDDFKEQQSYFRINGKETVFIEISKEPGENTINVANDVYTKIAELERNLPEGFRFVKEIDMSLKIRNEISDLFKNAGISFLILLLVLILFFKKVKYSLIILLSIVFSLLSSFIFFYAFNISLNILTIASLILGFGLMVDNSIVVIDYLDKHFIYDDKRRLAVTTRNIFFPVFASTLTTIIVFLPLIFLTGELKLYFTQFAAAIIITLSGSLVISFTVIPMLFYKVRLFKTKQKSKYSSSLNSTDYVSKAPFLIKYKISIPEIIYTFLLKKMFKWKKLSFIFFILTIGLPVWLLPARIEFPIISPVYNSIFDSELFSSVKKYFNYSFGGSLNLFFNHIQKGEVFEYGDTDYLIVSLRLPNGNRIERINNLVKEFESEVLIYKHDIENITSHVFDEENALIKITFTKEQSKIAFPYVLKNYLTAYAVRLGGLKVSVYGYGPGFFSGGGQMMLFVVEASGFNYIKLKDLANEFKSIIKRNPRIDNVDIDRALYGFNDEDIYEIEAKIKRNNLVVKDISVEELSNQIANSTVGNLGYNKLRIGNDEVFYSVKYSNYKDIQQNQLEDMILNSADKSYLKIKDMIDFNETKVLSTINRENQKYIRNISFDYKGPYQYGNEFVKSSIAQINIPEGYFIKQKTFSFLFDKEDEIQVWKILVISVMLIFMITAALFESLKKPFLIILAVPFALVGTIFLFYLGDYNLDRGAYAGMLLLVGLSVNNSIILVDYLSKNYHNNGFESVVKISFTRLRPIFATTFTTVFAMLPLMLASEQSFWKSLSLSTASGLIVSSIFLVLFIPILFYLLKKNSNTN